MITVNLPGESLVSDNQLCFFYQQPKGRPWTSSSTQRPSIPEPGQIWLPISFSLPDASCGGTGLPSEKTLNIFPQIVHSTFAIVPLFPVTPIFLVEIISQNGFASLVHIERPTLITSYSLEAFYTGSKFTAPRTALQSGQNKTITIGPSVKPLPSSFLGAVFLIWESWKLPLHPGQTIIPSKFFSSILHPCFLAGIIAYMASKKG
jgi:hypothetical protein